MPKGRAVSTIVFVMSMSAREGVGSPEGWLWIKTANEISRCLSVCYVRLRMNWGMGLVSETNDIP